MTTAKLDSLHKIKCAPKHIAGIIKNGGVKPNIIPEMTELDVYVRAPTNEELTGLMTKIKQCCYSAATATGCKVSNIRELEHQMGGLNATKSVFGVTDKV